LLYLATKPAHVGVDVDGLACPLHHPMTHDHQTRGQSLCALQEPKLGLDHSKPGIDLERLSCLGEEQRVSSREVTVGSRSWSGSIPCPMATPEQSWPPVAIAARSVRHETQGSQRSLEPRSAVEAGSRLGERARDHPFQCKCSPFCDPNKLPLAQKLNSAI
jgi:hypothetical protein